MGTRSTRCPPKCVSIVVGDDRSGAGNGSLPSLVAVVPDVQALAGLQRGDRAGRGGSTGARARSQPTDDRDASLVMNRTEPIAALNAIESGHLRPTWSGYHEHIT